MVLSTCIHIDFLVFFLAAFSTYFQHFLNYFTNYLSILFIESEKKVLNDFHRTTAFLSQVFVHQCRGLPFVHCISDTGHSQEILSSMLDMTSSLNSE